jgi:hypothetical protein
MALVFAHATADKRTAGNIGESEAAGLSAQFVKLKRRHVAPHRQMIGHRLKILAKRQ